MTPEEKKLLEIELAIRSQYGVICAIKPVVPFHDLPFSGKHKIKDICIRENDSIFHFGPYQVHGVENIKPYLRRMSSMTEEEDKEFALLQNDFYKDGMLYPIAASNMMKWLYSHHIDAFNFFLDRDLAIEAPEDMYKEITLSPDVEKKIVSEMDEYESELIRKESEAILESKRIVLD